MHFQTFVPRLIAACLLCLAASSPLAVEKGDEGDERPAPRQRGPDGLPKYIHHYNDGLYSTVTAMNTFPDLEVKKQKKIKLKVPGFRKEVPVYAILQNYKAPLVVVLLGIDGKVEGVWGGLFPYWYNEYNYHVLTFDSSFTPQYAETSGYGVAGNFEAEAVQTAAIIDAFLKTDDAKKVVTDVGVLGMSFGGSQALLLAAQARAGKLPFQLSGCLALSPPVKLRTVAHTVDRFFREDRWDTTMVELGRKFAPHVPVGAGEKIPFSATELRAAVGYVFRDGLAKLVERNDRVFKLKALPGEESGEHRASHAQAVGFESFIETFTFPYWKKKNAVQSIDELWAMSDLERLLTQLPDYAEAIVTADDPFNSPEDLAAAKASDLSNRLTVLPNGGHLGYIASDWMLVKSLRLFTRKLKRPDHAVDSEEKPAPDPPRQPKRDDTLPNKKRGGEFK